MKLKNLLILGYFIYFMLTIFMAKSQKEIEILPENLIFYDNEPLKIEINTTEKNIDMITFIILNKNDIQIFDNQLYTVDKKTYIFNGQHFLLPDLYKIEFSIRKGNKIEKISKTLEIKQNFSIYHLIRNENNEVRQEVYIAIFFILVVSLIIFLSR